MTDKEISIEQLNFMNNLQQFMKLSNTSQNRLAEHLRKTPTAISYYVNGKSMPPIEELNKICKYFGISIDDLINKKLTMRWE